MRHHRAVAGPFRQHQALKRSSRAKRGALLLVSAVLATGVVGATSQASAEDPAPSAAGTDPTLAWNPPGLGYVRQGENYVYARGAVVMTPASVSRRVRCPAGWVCLYRDTNFRGRVWRFRQDYWQNLRNYGASDEVSSWKNRTGRTAVLGKDSIEEGKAPYLYLSPHASSRGLGGWNDEASSICPIREACR